MNPEGMGAAPAAEVTRREILATGLRVGAATLFGAVIGERLLQSPAEAQTPVENAGIRKTDAEAHKAEADTDKTQAETRALPAKTDAEIAKTEAEAENLRADALQKRAEAEHTRATARTETAKGKAETRRIRNPFLESTYLTAVTGIISLLAAGGVKLGVRHSEHKAEIKADKQARQAELEKAEQQVEKEFASVLDNLHSLDPDIRDRASEALLAYDPVNHEGRQERIELATIGILKRRQPQTAQPAPVPWYTAAVNTLFGGAETPPAAICEPDLFDSNIVKAFFTAVPTVRDTLVKRREATTKRGNKHRSVTEIHAQILKDKCTPVISAERINLDGFTLHDEDMSLFDLENASCRNMKIIMGRIVGSSVYDTDFTDSQLICTLFARTGGRGVKFDGAVLDGSKFVEMNHDGIDLTRAKSLKGVWIDGTKGLSEKAITDLKKLGVTFSNKGADYNYGEEIPAKI